MLPSLPDIRSAIEDGSVLSPAVVESLDHDAILDARDDRKFSERWMQSYHAVNDVWNVSEKTDDVESLAEEIRRESFLTVSNSTSQHEIASYVSDDFDLIARASVLGLEDDFVEKLWELYAQNRIPSPSDSDE